MGYIAYRQKRHFFKSVNALASKRKRINNNYKIIITDSSIEYEDFELIRKEKWTAFRYFKITGEYTLLLRDIWRITPAIAIPIYKLSDANKIDLNNFLRSKLIQKV